MEIGVILNSEAGSRLTDQLRQRVVSAFERRGARVEVRVASKGAKLRQMAREMIEAGFETIVAGGGDGTVSAVASQLVGRRARLGIIPLGTLNHFARDLGLPLDVEAAAEVVCSGRARPVDVGMVNEHYFINNSSLGLYPDQVRVREKWRAMVGKWLAMLVASMIVLTRFRHLRIIAEFDGARIKRRCPLVVVGNNEYTLEPRNFTQRERLDGGYLSVYFLHEEGRAGLIRLALHSLVYRLDEAASFESYRAREVLLVLRRRRVRVALDGEVYKLRSPLRYSAVPGGLSVIAP